MKTTASSLVPMSLGLMELPYEAKHAVGNAIRTGISGKAVA